MLPYLTVTHSTVPHHHAICTCSNYNLCTPRHQYLSNDLERLQLEAAPEVNWEAEPGSLYTLLLEDQDVEAPPGYISLYIKYT